MDRARRLDAALDAMLAGAPLEDIDPDLRELVSLARTLVEQREALTPASRDSLRARLLRRPVVARRPSLRDRLAHALVPLVARSASLARVGAALLVLVLVAAGATAGSADSLPEDALYGWKLATEQARLALARATEDRAAAQLWIAEHRLAEAATLAERGRDVEADAAVSAFGEHVAAAAALLSRVPVQASPSLAARIRERLAQQERAIVRTSARLAATGAANQAALAGLDDVAAMVRPPSSLAPVRIATAAAQVAERAAAAANARVASPRPPATVRPQATASPVASPRPGQRSPTPRPATASSRQREEQAAKAAQESAKRAKEAADRTRDRN